MQERYVFLASMYEIMEGSGVAINDDMRTAASMIVKVKPKRVSTFGPARGGRRVARRPGVGRCPSPSPEWSGAWMGSCLPASRGQQERNEQQQQRCDAGPRQTADVTPDRCLRRQVRKQLQANIDMVESIYDQEHRRFSRELEREAATLTPKIKVRESLPLPCPPCLIQAMPQALGIYRRGGGRWRRSGCPEGRSTRRARGQRHTMSSPLRPMRSSCLPYSRW